MKTILFISLMLGMYTSVAQPSDFILLRKKDKTIRSYYAGSQIEFVSTTGVYKNALITSIANDTVYLQEFLVRRAMTSLGYYVTDTAGSYRYAYHYRQIGSIGKKQKGFDLSGSGSVLFGGGILLTLANAVVLVADRQKFSPAFMITSAGLAAIGYFLMKAGSKGIVIGKKHYRLEYVNVSGKPATNDN